MRTFLVAILSAIFYIPVNLYLMVFARDMFPCDLEVVQDAWIEILGGAF